MDKPKLKVTGIDKVTNYKGGPCSVIFEIVDEDGGVYESEIEMLNGFNKQTFQDSLVKVFTMCDAIPAEVCIKAFKQQPK